MDLLCSDQFSLEDDLILSQIADMAEDDTDQMMCSIITRARSLDYVPATNTGVWNVPSSWFEKMMATKNTFALLDEATKHTRVVLRKFN